MRYVKIGIATVGILALVGLCPVLSSGSPPAGKARASKYQVIYSFNGAPDGAGPMSDLTMDAAGNLYGTTSSGGAGTACNGGCGTVFELTPASNGWNEQVLYSFAGGHDGGNPQGGLIFDSAGNLYGTTAGTVFELSPRANGKWIEKVIYSFSSYGDPRFDLLLDVKGNLFGAAPVGGSGCDDIGCGAVFELTPQADGSWKETTVHMFTDTGVDGTFPSSGLSFDSAGNLYGMTEAGGTGSCMITLYDSYVIRGCGTLYELIPQPDGSWTESVVYNFIRGGGFGTRPSSEILFDGKTRLIGATRLGGDGFGTIFELGRTKKGWQQGVIHIFDGEPDGAGPIGRLVQDASGNLFGVTSGGGSFANMNGIVFELQPSKNGWKESILHIFANSPDGARPVAGLVSDSQGHLYGTTHDGGNQGSGTIYEVTP